ncbi:MAG TPA: bifunctional diaminohydroxyphosphoribosylaminopyrimidine deaminase/5-amino-6-(5-phosphoribosylamino)uracil reductase RibD [Acidobacteriota bacterium]|nr:bifunctional diaminohydroxyphosphoribosylaminopyrimidine deaminase/5-amino-6-(5-phosphoribosylamino)uracil reductase RibD [Acidobacteriota bacterium]
MPVEPALPSKDPNGPTAAERRAMRDAVALARRGVGGTHPNPRVGAILLRDGAVAGRGWHARAGGPHAEVVALRAAGPAARGATLVVTLEPCAHHGRTPPCVDAILEAGVRRVVVGMIDPNPIVNGRGIEGLRRAGVDVVIADHDEACRALNEPYLSVLERGRPWITLKAMLSLDGRLAADGGTSRGLGGPEEQRLCHRLRSSHDAVLVGIGTVLADDPLLTVRHARGRTPCRVVLDSSLRIPDGSALLGSAGKAPLVVATVSNDAARARRLEARGAAVWRFEPAPDGRVPLRPLLDRLVEEGRYALLVEGGTETHTSFLREGIADRVALGIAPLLLGGRSPRTWTGDLGRSTLAEAIDVTGLRARRVGRDLWLEGAIARPEKEAERV